MGPFPLVNEGLTVRAEREGPRPGSTMADVGRYFTPRCIGLHATLLVLLPVFAWLTSWQLGRALGGNTLSWAYTFEWPLFAGYAIYIWWQLIHDQPNSFSARRARSQQSSETTTGPVAAMVDDQAKEPGWALGSPVARIGRSRRLERSSRVSGRTSHHRRVRDQTPEEAEALAEYNRYLAALSADGAEDHPRWIPETGRGVRDTR